MDLPPAFRTSLTSSNRVFLIILVTILLALPLTVSVLQRQQELRQHAAGSTTPSGEDMPVGDISGWHQIFSDDFTTSVPLGSFPSAVSSKWFAYPDIWQDTSKNGTYSPSKVISV